MFTIIAIALFAGYLRYSASEDVSEVARVPVASFRKCCDLQRAADLDPECELANDSNYTGSTGVPGNWTTVCVEHNRSRTTQDKDAPNALSPTELRFCNSTCVVALPNGTTLIYRLPDDPESGSIATDLRSTSDFSARRTTSTSGHCDSVLTHLKFWGATIVVLANLIYVLPYIVVVTAYLIVPDLRSRAYDGAVICYNVSQILTNVILISLGFALLCRVPINPALYAPAGLSLMFLTISSTFWLFVICFDMTLVITRFRWAPRDDATREQERRKFRIYAGSVWGLTSVPTLFAAIVELAPGVPRSWPIRPNFEKFDDGPNLAVIVYVTALPMLVCFTNSVLFAYTTYRIIVARKSTALATRSDSRRARKRYVMFLRLYLLMDSPWITSALGAIYTDLWILKFFRMLQPILMLLAILPRKTFVKALKCSGRAKGADRNHDEEESKRHCLPCC